MKVCMYNRLSSPALGNWLSKVTMLNQFYKLYLRQVNITRWNFMFCLQLKIKVFTLGIAIPVMSMTSIGANAAGMNNNLQVHGFASQGFVYTSDNNFFGESSAQGSLDFTELGLNASLNPFPNLQFSAQLLSRRAGEGNDGDIRLDYGFADYSFVSNESDRWGVRLGRLKNPLGLYNDTRDVAFTRPSILLPQSIYFDRTRNLALSADSTQLYGEHRLNTGDVSFQFGVIKPLVGDPDTELAFLGRNRPGELDADISYIGRLMYERNNGQLRLALSGAQVNIGYAPGAPFPGDLLAGTIQFQPWILSGQYNADRWSFTTEYALRKFRFSGLGGISDREFSGESYYLQGTYRFTQKWEGVLRYDVLYSDKSDPDGSLFAATTGRPAHNRYAKDWAVGLRWNITPAFMLRAEYHRINGTGWLPLLDNPDLTTTEQNWDLFAILASYRF